MADSAVLISLLGTMLLGCLAFALVPLWRSGEPVGSGAALTSEASNLALWRDQRAELDADLQSGDISAEEYSRATDELALRAAPELNAEPTVTLRASSPRPWALGAIILIAVVALATATYWKVGSFGRATAPAPAAGASVPQVTAAQVAAMIDQLAGKLKENPSDAKGWELMAHAQSALGNFAQAVPAYERVIALRAPDAQLLADYADADAMLHDRSLAGRPTATLDRALKLDPSNAKALELAGTAALDRRDTAAAIGYWSRLEGILPEGSEDRVQVVEALRQLRSGSMQPPSSARAPLESAPRSAPVSSGANGTVSGELEIAPELLGKVTLNDTVFVFARAVDAAATQPHMPLAVMRISAKELPRAFELTDAMAMSPGLNLSSAPKVVVIARISKSGSAEARSGDLEGHSEPVAPGTSGLHIKIDHVVP